MVAAAFGRTALSGAFTSTTIEPAWVGVLEFACGMNINSGTLWWPKKPRNRLVPCSKRRRLDPATARRG
jgi:hypothetical protein